MTLFSGKTQLPAYLSEIKEDAVTKALAGGGGFGKRISIRGNVFRIISDGAEVATTDDRSINVVVVGASNNVARTYYKDAYQEGETTAPTCWSADGINPDPSVKEKQGESCAKCPQNVAGSGTGDTRACRYSQRLAIVLETDIEGDVYQVSLPSQSIFGKGENGKLPMQAYAKFLKGHNVPITAVVTEMRFDTSSATPKLFFKAMRPLEESEYRTCVKQAATDDAKNAVMFTVAQTDGVLPKPKLEEKPEPAAKPVMKEVHEFHSKYNKPEPVVEKKDESKKGFQPVKKGVSPEVAEPKKVEKAKVEAPADKKDLASIVKAWADEE